MLQIPATATWVVMMLAWVVMMLVWVVTMLADWQDFPYPSHLRAFELAL